MITLRAAQVGRLLVGKRVEVTSAVSGTRGGEEAFDASGRVVAAWAGDEVTNEALELSVEPPLRVDRGAAVERVSATPRYVCEGLFEPAAWKQVAHVVLTRADPAGRVDAREYARPARLRLLL